MNRPLLSLALASALVGTTGCGERFSNEPLIAEAADQDAELAAAIPEQDEFSLSAPKEADAARPKRTCAGDGASKAACRSFKFATGVSQLTKDLMQPIKRLSALPPTRRTPGRRVWGPDRAPEGYWRRVEARKLDDDPPGVAWAIEVSETREGPYRAVLSGQRGDLTYDGDIAREVLGKDDAGVLHIETAGEGCERTLRLDLAGFRVGGDGKSDAKATDGSFRFLKRCDGSGRMDWGFLTDHPVRDCKVSTTLVVRWADTGAGRADPRFGRSECWDPDFQVVPGAECAFEDEVEPEDVTVPEGSCGRQAPG